MRSSCFAVLVVMLLGIAGLVHANLDDFNGAKLDDMWTYRDPLGNGDYRIEDGKLILDLKLGSDMYIQGVDGGVMLLMDPPELEDYTIEMKVNAMPAGFMTPASQLGIVLFNEEKWAYTLWGPYASTDIRVEDCIGASYRWRAEAQIGVNQTDVLIDDDVWIKVVKTGTSMEFFAKGNADEDWLSGGVDELLGPNFTPGDYKVGIFFKSWGGSTDGSFEVDFFNIPEIAAVDAAGKLVTTWSAIKR